MRTQKQRQRDIFWAITFLFLVLALGKAGFEFSRVLLYEARGAIDSDLSLFYLVGRAMLNGADLYTEIFETKPPGILALSALSLALTGGPLLMTILSVGLFLLLPTLVVVFSLQQCKKRGASRLWAWAVALLALIVTILLELYIEIRSAGMLTEFWGGMFGALYALTIVWGRSEDEALKSKRSIIRISLAALCLLGSIGMKEPFLLINFAVAALLTRHLKEFARLFVLPLAIGGVIGLLLSAVFGILEPFLNVYLPMQLSGRVGGDQFEPVWVRGFAAGRVFANLRQYHPSSPMLAFLVGILWMNVPLFKSGASKLLTSLLSIGQLLTLYYLFPSIQVLIILHKAAASGVYNEALKSKTLDLVLIQGAIFIVLTVLLYRKKMPWHVMTAAAAMFIASMVVGVGDYVGTHFSFAFPIYFALVPLLICYLAAQEGKNLVIPGLIWIVAIVTALTTTVVAAHMEHLEKRIQYSPVLMSDYARRLDGLMDSCGYEYYYGIDTYQHFAFAKHSIIGPFPIITFMEFWGINHQYVHKTHSNIRDKASLIVKSPGELSSEFLLPLNPIIRDYFIDDVPDCAKEFLPIGDFEVVFRK